MSNATFTRINLDANPSPCSQPSNTRFKAVSGNAAKLALFDLTREEYDEINPTRVHESYVVYAACKLACEVLHDHVTAGSPDPQPADRGKRTPAARAKELREALTVLYDALGNPNPAELPDAARNVLAVAEAVGAWEVPHVCEYLPETLSRVEFAAARSCCRKHTADTDKERAAEAKRAAAAEAKRAAEARRAATAEAAAAEADVEPQLAGLSDEAKTLHEMKVTGLVTVKEYLAEAKLLRDAGRWLA